MADPAALRQLTASEQETIAWNKVKNEHTITDFKFSPIRSSNGYLGEYFNVEITIKEKNKQASKHKFFMKTLPFDGWQTEYVNEGMFEKEVSFYKDVSAILRSLISTDVYAKCFLASPGKLVLDDAIALGYRPVQDLVAPLDYQHTKTGIITLARLHAASFIYEEKYGRKLDKDFPEVAREVIYIPGTSGMTILGVGGDAIAALAPHLESDLTRDPKAIAQLQAHVKSWMNKLDFYLNEDSQHRRVICHGDSWPANYLYKYDNQGKPTSAILVDFQMTRYRSPAADINSFLYWSVPAHDLKKWRESLLDTYYQVLSEELENAGLDANKTYPRQEFLQACIYYQIVGIIFGLLFYPFSRASTEVMSRYKSDREAGRTFYYKDRRQHLIDCYKSSPIMRMFVNGATSDLYHYFIQTNRGFTEFTS